jgi:hypothetical protein
MDKEVEEKTYSLTFDDGQFIFTDIATQKSGPVSVDVAYANSNQIDVDVSEEVLNILKLT